MKELAKINIAKLYL